MPTVIDLGLRAVPSHRSRPSASLAERLTTCMSTSAHFGARFVELFAALICPARATTRLAAEPDTLFLAAAADFVPKDDFDTWRSILLMRFPFPGSDLSCEFRPGHA